MAEVAQKVCGAPHPVTARTCVARHHHVHHRDADGRQWPNSSSPASPVQVSAAGRVAEDTMTFDQATDQLYFWGGMREMDVRRDRAFDALLGWVAGRATVDPDAASALRLIRDRAERS